MTRMQPNLEHEDGLRFVSIGHELVIVQPASIIA